MESRTHANICRANPRESERVKLSPTVDIGTTCVIRYKASEKKERRTEFAPGAYIDIDLVRKRTTDREMIFDIVSSERVSANERRKKAERIFCAKKRYLPLIEMELL